MTMSQKKPLVLLILDGWGERAAHNDNPIYSTRTPTFDRLFADYPHISLEASGAAVGLPDGQMGNSKVGHLHLGSGRRLPQELVRVTEDIASGVFFENAVFTQALQTAKQNNKAVHITGLLSPGGVHSHEQHVFAMLRMAADFGVERIYVHAILDGRDTPPKSALASLQQLDAMCAQHGAQVLSVVGRYYAMDRDKRWERTQQAYDLIVQAQADYIADSAETALLVAYQRGETDEFVQATRVAKPDADPILFEDGDVFVFMNFRADRARQFCAALTQQQPMQATRPHLPKPGRLVTLTQYATDLPAEVAYPALEIKQTLGECLAAAGLTQLRLAETEKYAHVTYFFNGGNEVPNAGEERILVPSPKVATYDLQPEMSALEVTEKLIAAITSEQYDVIICNYANPDMVGHTGNAKAASKAVAVMDDCLAKVLAAIESVDAELLVTSDHGNIEQMYDHEQKQPHTAHTTNLVPLIYFGTRAVTFKSGGSLADVAPTMLALLDLPKPGVMTGESLLA